MIRQALTAGADINAIGPGGQTPLLFAVLSGKEKAAKVLVDSDADLTATEKDGYNVLHAAGFQGRADILKMLLPPTQSSMRFLKHMQYRVIHLPKICQESFKVF